MLSTKRVFTTIDSVAKSLHHNFLSRVLRQFNEKHTCLCSNVSTVRLVWEKRGGGRRTVQQEEKRYNIQ